MGYGEEPVGIYLTAIVDVEGIDEVFDLYIDRLVDLQVEERLPLYLNPVRPLERPTESSEVFDPDIQTGETFSHLTRP
ncbi:hypothetical protein BH20CHL1_BH20CHL1_07890 [soil metagenome]